MKKERWVSSVEGWGKTDEVWGRRVKGLNEEGWWRWGEGQEGEGWRMMDEGVGVGDEGWKIHCVGRGEGWWKWATAGSDLDLYPDPDPWKILWIRFRIWQNDADPLDPDPQHWWWRLGGERRGQVFFWTWTFSMLMTASTCHMWTWYCIGHGIRWHFSWLDLDFIYDSEWITITYDDDSVSGYVKPKNFASCCN